MPELRKDHIPNYQLYMLMVGMLITGTCNTLVMKAQDEVVVGFDEKTQKNIKFTHPYFQACNMFIGEFCCMGAWAVKTKMNKKKREENKEDQVPLSPGATAAEEV